MSVLSEQFIGHFSNLQDPRVENHNFSHKLIDIVVYTLLAVICGADSWVDVEEFGKAKQEWLLTFLELPHGIASHDVIGNLFSRLNAEEFNQCFISWVNTISTASNGRIIPIDGKTLCGSYKDSDKKTAIHIVSAWCDENSIVLGQYKTEEKSNEITAIPELLNLIDIKGAIVTIDAMGCQKTIAKKITDHQGDYILAVKGNQPHLYEDVKKIFSNSDNEPQLFNHYETSDKKHGRVEHRSFYTVSSIDIIRNKDGWEQLTSIGKVKTTVFRNDKWQTEERYYISSRDGDVIEFANATRKHWGVENKLHWMLDVNFSEDMCRVREGYAAQNFSLFRKFALTLLTKDKSSKVGVAAKRKKAGWSNKFLIKILKHISPG